MSRLGEFANIYELLDESDSSGVETGKKAQVALAEKKAAAAAAMAPTQPRPPAQTGNPQGQRPSGAQRQDRNPSGERGPRTDRPPRSDRPREDRPPRTDRPREDRPPRGDRPPRPRPPQSSPKLEGGESTFSAEGQAAASGAPRPGQPRDRRGGPRPDRGYERRHPGDQDQRPGKREYDRHSGTGRGKEVAKGGAGKGGWGSIEDEAAEGLEGAKVETEPKVKKEGEENVAEATPAEATEAAAAAVPEDEEPKVRSLEEYQQQRSKSTASLPPARQAGEGETSSEWEKYTAFQKKEDTLGFTVAEKTKKKDNKEKEKEATEKKVSADQVLKFQQERRERPERGDREKRGGNTPRGTGRGAGNQGGQKRGKDSALNFGDVSAFPTLSTKA